MRIKLIVGIAILLSCAASFSEQEFVYNSHGRRDPFLPLVSKEGYLVNREADIPATDMNLEGIIYDESGRSLAIINGSVLKAGDKISTYTIIKIERQKVTLRSETEDFVLELKKQED